MILKSSSFSRQASRRSRRRGAALLEFALVATMFLALLMGMLQFGVYLSTSNSLWNLSREGARFASVQNAENDNTDDVTVTGVKTDNNKLIIDHVSKESPVGMLPPDIDPRKLTVSIEPSKAKSRTKGTEVKITLTYNMSDKIFVPLGNLLPKSYTTTTSMMVE